MSLKTAELYDKRAHHYELDMRLAGYCRLLHDALKQISAQAVFPRQANVLDVGCGTGLSSRIVRQYIPDARITGLDLSERMLDRYAQENNCSFIGDFNDPPSIAPFRAPAERLEDLAPFSFALSAASISEYGSQAAIEFVRGLLDDTGQFLIIGMQDNGLAKFTGKFWNYTPSGARTMAEYCRNAGFSSVSQIAIPWKFPVLRKHKFIILARV